MSALRGEKIICLVSQMKMLGFKHAKSCLALVLDGLALIKWTERDGTITCSPTVSTLRRQYIR